DGVHLDARLEIKNGGQDLVLDDGFGGGVERLEQQIFHIASVFRLHDALADGSGEQDVETPFDVVVLHRHIDRLRLNVEIGRKAPAPSEEIVFFHAVICHCSSAYVD